DRAVINPNGQKGVGSNVSAVLNTNSSAAGCTGSIVPLSCLSLNGGPIGKGSVVGYVGNTPNAQYVRAGYGARTNAGRNTLRVPKINNLDFTLFKNFRITENHRLQFRAQMFNALNHPQFLPRAGTSGAAFSLVNLGNPLFNQPTQLFNSGSRVIELAVRYSF